MVLRPRYLHDTAWSGRRMRPDFAEPSHAELQGCPFFFRELQ
jgi:hypothetical protein